MLILSKELCSLPEVDISFWRKDLVDESIYGYGDGSCCDRPTFMNANPYTILSSNLSFFRREYW